MNEKCKYCNYVLKCSPYCEYNSVICKLLRSFPKAVDKSYEELQQENQELKKQLENCYCNRTDCSSRIKDSKKYDSLVQKVEKQQKEFIKYLEDEIKECNAYSKYIEKKLQELKSRYSGKTYIANEIMKNERTKECYKKSLSKYREIIGVKDE